MTSAIDNQSADTAAQPDLDLLRDLAAFSRRFATMVDSGISLVRCLAALEELPPPLGEASRNLRERVQIGHSLSESMRDRPDIFSPCYSGLIRAGEVGGILEEVLERLAVLLVKEWQLVRDRPQAEEPLFLFSGSSGRPPESWAGLTRYQRAMTLALFLEAFSAMLIAGVPILQVMELIRDLLPRRQADQWMAVRFAVRNGSRSDAVMRQMAIFPQFVLEMVRIGEESGSLDRTLHKAAEVLERDLEFGLLAGEFEEVGVDHIDSEGLAALEGEGVTHAANNLIRIALDDHAFEVKITRRISDDSYAAEYLMNSEWRPIPGGSGSALGFAVLRRLAIMADIEPSISHGKCSGVIPVLYGTTLYHIEAQFDEAAGVESAHLRISEGEGTEK